MTDDEVIDAFRRVRCWEREGQRAPHKPLLLLLALARMQRGEDLWLEYEGIEEPLRKLLRDFGPPRKSYHPEYPFWRLRADGKLWTIADVDQLGTGANRQGDVPASILRERHVRASLGPEIVAVLRRRPSLVNRVAEVLLEGSFPTSMHQDLLDALGFPWIAETDARRRRRDPDFREAILRAYERRCAVCGYDGRLGATELGLEAAHVKWHGAGGPDTVENGIALCVFHHKSLDRGAIGLDDERHIVVSQDVHGQARVDALLLGFIGQPLRLPQRGQPPPEMSFLRWHRKEVFRPPPRQAR